ncbi:MAG: methyltransferase domain-containing protein [Planctomycetes bacterium]|nr:methyltransferase domain-containing protein [Planctomycetota bacterium]
MDDSARLMEVFFDVQRGLPRQGPGADASTRRALALCAGLPAAPRVLDVGCGPGMQTLALLRALPAARLTAVDLYREYLDELAARAAAAGVADRVAIVRADMRELPFPDASFDLVWSEGAAWVMGFDAALWSWRRLLAPAGCLAVSELVWLRDDPPEEVATFFASEYPAMAAAQQVADRFPAAGYELLGRFTLPDSAWWDDYYRPLAAKLPALRARYAGDPTGAPVVELTATEIDLRRRYPDCYGYEFFVARAR